MTYITKSGTAYPVEFFVDDGTGVGVTGLLNAAFTKKLFKNGTFQSGLGVPTITVAEMDSTNAAGWYTATYTPNATGRWFSLITHASYGNPGGWTDVVLATTNDIDSLIANLLATDLSTVEGSMSSSDKTLAMAIALLTNKRSISGSTMTLKKTNGSTTLETYTLTFDATQNPIQSFTPN